MLKTYLERINHTRRINGIREELDVAHDELEWLDSRQKGETDGQRLVLETMKQVQLQNIAKLEAELSKAYGELGISRVEGIL